MFITNLNVKDGSPPCFLSRLTKLPCSSRGTEWGCLAAEAFGPFFFSLRLPASLRVICLMLGWMWVRGKLQRIKEMTYLDELAALRSHQGPCTADGCDGWGGCRRGHLSVFWDNLISDKLYRQTCVFFSALKMTDFNHFSPSTGSFNNLYANIPM